MQLWFSVFYTLHFMDRKAWIILTICLALLGLNFYYQQQHRPQTNPSEATTQSAGATGATGTTGSASTRGSVSDATGGAKEQVPSALDNTKNVAGATGGAKEAVPSALDGGKSGAGTENVASAINPPSNPKPSGLVKEERPSSDLRKFWSLTSSKEVDGKSVPEVRFTFTNVGGALEYAEMLNQTVDSKRCNERNIKINENASTGIGTLMFTVNGTRVPLSDTALYDCVEATDTKIVFQGKAANELLVRKEYTLSPTVDEKNAPVPGAPYLLKLRITIMNPTDRSLEVGDMGLFAGFALPANKAEGDYYIHYFWENDGGFTQETASSFKGGFFSSPQSFAWKQAPNFNFAGAMGQFFVSVLIPEKNASGESVLAYPREALLPDGSHNGTGAEIVVSLPKLNFGPNEAKSLNYDIFTGPKLNQMLGDMPFALKEVMAYGWLTPISAPMNWLLNILHGFFGNWGWAIIGMTIVVRGIIWPLHKKSYMAMKRMSQLQPMMKELKEKYPNDPNKLNMEMMKLYQKFGINPMSGCLPMLIQIPIFFAFYRVLQSSAELRGEPFVLWVTDLARPDTVWDIHLPFALPFLGTELPINILPFIMGITMIIQMRLTPKAGDKMQQRIMNLMPIMFFAFCYNFASALALYWTTQNLISIGQTYLIRRLPEPKLEKKNKKPGFFQRLMEQQRLMMEQQAQQRGQGQGGGHGSKDKQNSSMRNITPKK